MTRCGVVMERKKKEEEPFNGNSIFLSRRGTLLCEQDECCRTVFDNSHRSQDLTDGGQVPSQRHVSADSSDPYKNNMWLTDVKENGDRQFPLQHCTYRSTPAVR